MKKKYVVVCIGGMILLMNIEHNTMQPMQKVKKYTIPTLITSPIEPTWFEKTKQWIKATLNRIFKTTPEPWVIKQQPKPMQGFDAWKTIKQQTQRYGESLRQRWHATSAFAKEQELKRIKQRHEIGYIITPGNVNIEPY